MATQKIVVPDIGTTEEVDVIDVMVSPGDTIAVDDSLITLESDKASMDVPSPVEGVVKSVALKVGDKVTEGSLILELEAAEKASSAPNEEPQAAKEEAVQEAPETRAEVSAAATQDILVPDIGTEDAVDVIEVTVKVGDEIAVDDALITLESDKASMDVPAPMAGKVKEVYVKVGDQVKTNTPILSIASSGGVDEKAPAEKPAAKSEAAEAPQAKPSAAPANASAALPDNSDVHAGPAVRRLARELGVDLSKVSGNGRKGRITLEDVHQFVKAVMQQAGGSAGSGIGLNLPKPPVIDFSKFGETTVQPLSKIKKISGANLQRNWITIPHVTQFDEADITDMEEFRKTNKAFAEKQGYKLTPLVFIMKAVVATLKAFPSVNASLDATGENLILKNYYHIGVAVDTPNGLVVPVIRDVDKKSFMDLAKELGEISIKARDKGLSLTDMQGASFTISSLGGISGTGFTPIVNMPEVAILGVSRSAIKPVYQNNEFVPRLMLPLSFSYDHRVIDGAEAARFTKHLSLMLSDLRRILL